IASQRREILDQGVHKVEAMRPLGMTCNLGLLPGRELGVGIDQRRAGLLFELLDLIRDRYRPLLAFHGAQLGDLAFQLGDRLLEIEIGADGGTIQNWSSRRNSRGLARTIAPGLRICQGAAARRLNAALRAGRPLSASWPADDGHVPAFSASPRARACRSL